MYYKRTRMPHAHNHIVLNRCVSLLPDKFCLHVPKHWTDILRLAPTVPKGGATPDKCTENRELGNALLQDKFHWMQVCASARLHVAACVRFSSACFNCVVYRFRLAVVFNFSALFCCDWSCAFYYIFYAYFVLFNIITPLFSTHDTIANV